MQYTWPTYNHYDRTLHNISHRLKITSRMTIVEGHLIELGFTQEKAKDLAENGISIHDYLFDEEGSPGFHIAPIKLSECVRITIDLELISRMLKKETDND